MKLSLCVRPLLYSLSSCRKDDDISGELGLAIFGIRTRHPNKKFGFWTVRNYKQVQALIFLMSTRNNVRMKIIFSSNIFKEVN